MTAFWVPSIDGPQIPVSASDKDGRGYMFKLTQEVQELGEVLDLVRGCVQGLSLASVSDLVSEVPARVQSWEVARNMLEKQLREAVKDKEWDDLPLRARILLNPKKVANK